MTERFSPIDRVIGKANEKYKKDIFEGIESNFKANKKRETDAHEISKTPETLAVIVLANEATNGLRRKYGFSDFNIPPENIYIIKEEYWDWSEGHNARTYLDEQIITTPYQGNNFNFARLMFHEMLHLKSFTSIRVVDEDKKMLEFDRNGLAVQNRGEKRMSLSKLDEALTEMLTKRFIEDLFKAENSLFKDHIDALKSRGINLKNLENDYNNHGVIFGYGEEREALGILVDKIFAKNSDKFKDKEAVLDVFIRSKFSSNLLELGKLVDKTFGIGTLRKIGKFPKSDKLLKFVNSL